MANPGGEVGVGLAPAQVRQHQQGLLSDREAPLSDYRAGCAAEATHRSACVRPSQAAGPGSCRIDRGPAWRQVWCGLTTRDMPEGFALGEHHDAGLAYAALAMAVAVRGGRDAIAGVILHTDQGSEYTAGLTRTACDRLGIRQSMGRPGSALDNAVIESWHSTVEFELRRLEHFATKTQARAKVAAWIEDYNHDRRHSALGMLSPIAYERSHTMPGPRAGGELLRHRAGLRVRRIRTAARRGAAHRADPAP